MASKGNRDWPRLAGTLFMRGREGDRMRSLAAVFVAAAVAASFFIASANPAAADNAVLGSGTTLYVDPASTTQQAAAKLDGQARDDALVLGSFPSATWFTKGAPAEVQAAVKKLVDAAAAKSAVPAIVA